MHRLKLWKRVFGPTFATEFKLQRVSSERGNNGFSHKTLIVLKLILNKHIFSCHLFLKLFHLYNIYKNTEKNLELIWPAKNIRFRLTSNRYGTEQLVTEIYRTLIPRNCSRRRNFVWKVPRFFWAKCLYLGCTENSQNTPISISRGLYVVPELSVPSIEIFRRPLMFVRTMNEENFGIVAFVLKNTDFFGELPKSGIT